MSSPPTFAGHRVARFCAVLALGLVFAATAGGCGHNIGDECTTSADCDPSGGTRTCDLSQPGGYCIVEGCDARSCPDDSVCVRFFPAGYSTQMCTTSAMCDADEECANSFCVRRTLEKRICVKSCGDNGDCRGGYTCRPTGEGGAVALTLTAGGTARFCGPTGP